MLKTEDLQVGPRNNLRIILNLNCKKQPAWNGRCHCSLLTRHLALCPRIEGRPKAAIGCGAENFWEMLLVALGSRIYID